MARTRLIGDSDRVALFKVRQRQVQHHRKWMIRNYSLTFAAVTLRIWLLIFILIAGIENYETSYIIISWLCWIPNLLIAEFYVRKSDEMFNNRIDFQEESTIQ